MRNIEYHTLNWIREPINGLPESKKLDQDR